MGRRKGVRAASKCSIAIDFRYGIARCRETVRLEPNERNQRFVANMKAAIERDIAMGNFDYAKYFPHSPRARKFAKQPSALYLMGELFTEYLADIHARVEPETYGDYAEYIANIWRPRFGKKPANEMTLELVQSWVAEQTASKKRILNLLTPLRGTIQYAVGVKKLFAVSPIAKVTVVRPRGARSPVVDPLTPDEWAAISAVLTEPDLNLFSVWIWGGYREGELIALLWPDVSFERSAVSIDKSSRAGRLKAPKTATGKREVKILAPALEALNRQKAHTRLANKHVFLNAGTGQPWAHDKPIRNRWREACAAAGVRYRPPKQLRHTYASWLLSAGENPMWVSKQMGHADLTVTLRVYAKYIKDMNPGAGELAVSAYKSVKPGSTK